MDPSTLLSWCRVTRDSVVSLDFWLTSLHTVMTDNDGQPNSNDFRAIATSINNSLTREEYLLRKAKIDDAREKLAQLELEIELQETMRQGREAE